MGLGSAWISLVFPAALIVDAAAECRGWTATVLDHLGRLSCAIYILHAPVVLLTFAVFQVALGEAWNASPGFLAASATVVALVASAAATYLLDEPLRARLRGTRPRPRPRPRRTEPAELALPQAAPDPAHGPQPSRRGLGDAAR